MKIKANASEPDLAHDVAADLRAVMSKLKRKLRAQSSDGDLTATQIAVLLRLERDGPTTASNLARAEGIRAQSMSTALAPLETGGLIVGAPDPTDGRRTIVSLTEACRSRIQEGRAARQDWLSRSINAKLSPDEQRQLLAAIDLLKRLVDK